MESVMIKINISEFSYQVTGLKEFNKFCEHLASSIMLNLNQEILIQILNSYMFFSLFVLDSYMLAVSTNFDMWIDGKLGVY